MIVCVWVTVKGQMALTRDVFQLLSSHTEDSLNMLMQDALIPAASRVSALVSRVRHGLIDPVAARLEGAAGTVVE